MKSGFTGYLFLPGLLDEATASALKDEVLDVMKQSQDSSRDASPQTQGSEGMLIQTSQYLRGSHPTRSSTAHKLGASRRN